MKPTRRETILFGAAAALAHGLPAFSQTRDGDIVDWSTLAERLGGRLKAVTWPIQALIDGQNPEKATAFFEAARNPYFLGDNPALTQTFGWVDAWSANPSARVVEARSAEDVAIALRFAAEHNIPIVTKGGGHSYTGGSNAPDSLMIWTRRMNDIVVHDHFTPMDSENSIGPAVSIGAGAMWGEVYKQACAAGGVYVQGGGCLTVGVAGLILSGGFGSLSKAFGPAALSLVEAEVVTADGEIRIVNTKRDSELFHALRGGGGGTFGVVTRLTVKSHPMPSTIGAVFADISASTDEAYHLLIGQMMRFYAERLLNPQWGEQIGFGPNNVLRISMLCHSHGQDEIKALWAPFLEWVRERSDKFNFQTEPAILAVDARSFFDPDFLKTLPGIVLSDDQSGADQDRIFWAGDREQSGQFLHAYRSRWIPTASLETAGRDRLVAGLFDASRHWTITLHTNKGLGGSTDAVRQAVVEETVINPVVADSFALAICGAEGPPGYPGVAGFAPDIELGREQAERVNMAMAVLETRVGARGSYLAETNYFETEWEENFWGRANYHRLQAVKRMFDPENRLQVHHGVVG